MIKVIAALKTQQDCTTCMAVTGFVYSPLLLLLVLGLTI